MGCLHFCLDARIDGMTLFTSRGFLTFNGHILRHQPQPQDLEEEIRILDTYLTNIDSAFMDMKTLEVFVIKGQNMLSLEIPPTINSRVQINQTSTRSVSQTFAINWTVNAITHDFRSKEVLLFSVKQNNSFKYFSTNCLYFSPKERHALGLFGKFGQWLPIQKKVTSFGTESAQQFGRCIY